MAKGIKSKATNEREAGMATAVLACRKTVRTAESSGNCGICGRGEHDLSEASDHEDDGPYLDAKKALRLLGLDDL